MRVDSPPLFFELLFQFGLPAYVLISSYMSELILPPLASNYYTYTMRIYWGFGLGSCLFAYCVNQSVWTMKEGLSLRRLRIFNILWSIWFWVLMDFLLTSGNDYLAYSVCPVLPFLSLFQIPIVLWIRRNTEVSKVKPVLASSLN